jgi:predicted TPR repeat methyltransferase/Tfp pilus assembly protein PilF
VHTIFVTADADKLCSRAAELVDAGRPEAARPLLAAARALGPPSPELTVTGARIALSTGAMEQALQELDRGIEAAPSHGALRKCRANVRRAMGDLEGATRDAAEAVFLDASDPQAKAMLGTALLALGRTGEAVACLAEAVEGAPADLDSRQMLATALENFGDADAALLALTDGIARCPSSVAMHNAAILLCIRRRDFTGAGRLAERARRLGVADASTFGMKGHALSSLGRHDEAASAYQDALKLGPEDPYVRYLAASSGATQASDRAPEDYVRVVFDGYADRFESHLISLGYSIPVAIRFILQRHPKVVAGLSLGPVLDLGCGTGLVALAIGDLPLGPLTGIDLSPRMLAHARAKQLYSELRAGDIMTDMATYPQRWPLIVAADVLCYFGALDVLFGQIHQSLEPDGWFIFSVEEVVEDHDGVVPDNGNWALHSQGRYAHASDYVCEAACAAGLRVLHMDRLVLRHEAGAAVPGLLLVLQRVMP